MAAGDAVVESEAAGVAEPRAEQVIDLGNDQVRAGSGRGSRRAAGPAPSRATGRCDRSRRKRSRYRGGRSRAASGSCSLGARFFIDLRRLCHRRLCPAHRGLAGVAAAPRRASCWTRWSRRSTPAGPAKAAACPPQRQGRAISVHQYTERLAEAGIAPSVGSVGDSYDNALAETVSACSKPRSSAGGPWRSIEAVEFATLEWVDWFNHRRLLEPIGNIPPAEAEARYYAELETRAVAA